MIVRPDLEHKFGLNLKHNNPYLKLMDAFELDLENDNPYIKLVDALTFNEYIFRIFLEHKFGLNLEHRFKRLVYKVIYFIYLSDNQVRS